MRLGLCCTKLKLWETSISNKGRLFLSSFLTLLSFFRKGTPLKSSPSLSNISKFSSFNLTDTAVSREDVLPILESEMNRSRLVQGKTRHLPSQLSTKKTVGRIARSDQPSSCNIDDEGGIENILAKSDQINKKEHNNQSNHRSSSAEEEYHPMVAEVHKEFITNIDTSPQHHTPPTLPR